MSQQHVDALTLASWGTIAVVPSIPPTWDVPSAGKRPMWNLSFNDATLDINQIDSWWFQQPDANILGRPPAWAVVLDVDVRSGGLDTWQELNQGQVLPFTFVTQTGSGGLHVWYRLPYKGELNGTAGQGIDIKHHGGMLVMPGSIHPATGDLYRVKSWHNPEDLPVLPHHLRRHVYKPIRRPRSVIPVSFRRKGDGTNLINMVLEAQPGERNNTLNRATFIAAKNDIDIFDDLQQAAESIGLNPVEIQATMRSAINAAGKSAA